MEKSCISTEIKSKFLTHVVEVNMIVENMLNEYMEKYNLTGFDLVEHGDVKSVRNGKGEEGKVEYIYIKDL